MSLINKLVKQSSHYFIGELLAVLSGFISFPIFTRIFTKEEYGIISLVTITLGLANTIISGGLRPAIVRFYPTAKKEGVNSLKLFYSTIMLTVISFSIIGILLLLAINYAGFLDFLNPLTKKILSFSSILILYRVTTATIRTFLQCEDKTIMFNVTYVAEKYLGLFFALLLVLHFQIGISGLFIGLIIGEGIIFIVLLWRVVVFLKGSFFKFSSNILSENLSYGLPLLGTNLASFVNNSGSRYLIEYFIGTAAVAMYSVSFNLALYIQNLMIFTLNKALIPITMNLWVEKGKIETQKFLTKFINIYFMIGIPIIFGLTAVGRNFLVVVASEKYAESSSIIIWIISGLIVSGAYFPLLAGLYLEKKTKIVAMVLAIGAVVNIIVSAVLLPIMGIKGAAIGIFAGNIVYIIIGYIKSSKFLKVQIDYISVLRFIVISIVMYYSICFTEGLVGNDYLLLIIQIALGILIYAILMLLFDPEIKNAYKNILLPKFKK
jgi:O-antigen/teichoic acid export membrane protein